PSVNNPRAPPQVARNDRDSGVLSDDLITRGPVATPAGHVSLPTHREVYGRCFRISAPRVSLPFGSRAFSCVSAFHAAASVQYVTCRRRLAYVEIPQSEEGDARFATQNLGKSHAVVGLDLDLDLADAGDTEIGLAALLAFHGH